MYVHALKQLPLKSAGPAVPVICFWVNEILWNYNYSYVSQSQSNVSLDIHRLIFNERFIKIICQC